MVFANPPTTSPAQRCRIRIAGDSFAAARSGLGARAVAVVHVDGDYTRALAKVAVEPAGPAQPHDGDDAGPTIGSWSGSFNGPRDAFVDMLQRRVCTDEGRVHVLLPRGPKDPSQGEVALDVFVLTPDEHRDVDNLCHAYERAPKPAASSTKDAADAAAMKWAEDVLTTAKWDEWRHDLARERGELFARKADATSLFHARGATLAAAATAEKLACPTATDWTKR
ncbi:MAG TPA: hypothetical protein VLM85_15800 [Polyangiaceae bacterium]|nr:hypothetical protein [Polyangiaceae bacterium]